MRKPCENNQKQSETNRNMQDELVDLVVPAFLWSPIPGRGFQQSWNSERDAARAHTSAHASHMHAHT